MLAAAAEKAGLPLDGPHPALLVQGDDELGALAGVQAREAVRGERQRVRLERGDARRTAKAATATSST